MRDQSIGVNLVGRDISASKTLNKVGSTAKAVSKSLALAGAAAGAFAIKLAKDSVAAAIADEKAQAALNRTIANAGFANATSAVANYVDQLQRATGVADDELRPAFTSLFNATQDIAVSQLMLEQAMSVSLGTGKDLATVASAYSKALAGNRKGLIALGSGLDVAYLKTADLVDVFAALDTRFAGQTQANLETVAGKMSRLNIAAGEAEETIGVALIDAFSQLAGNGDITAATQKIDSLADSIAGFIREASGVERPTSWLTAFINEIGSAASRNLKLLGKLVPDMPKPADTAMTAREKAAREASKQTDEYFKKLAAEDRLKALLAAKEKARLAAEKKAAAAAAAKAKAAAAEKAKADKAKVKAAEKELKLKKLAAKYDLELIGIEAAKKRAGSTDEMNRLLDKQNIALGDLGLTAAQAGMTTGNTPNITVNQTVQGSVVTEQELSNQIQKIIAESMDRNGGRVSRYDFGRIDRLMGGWGP